MGTTAKNNELEYIYIANMFLEILDISCSLITIYCGCEADYTKDIQQAIKNYFFACFKIFTVLKNM